MHIMTTNSVTLKVFMYFFPGIYLADERFKKGTSFGCLCLTTNMFTIYVYF